MVSRRWKLRESWVMSQSLRVNEKEIVHACREAVFDAQGKKRSASRGGDVRGTSGRKVREARWRWTFAFGCWWWTYHVPGSPGATAPSRSSDSSSSSGKLVGLTVSDYWCWRLVRTLGVGLGMSRRRCIVSLHSLHRDFAEPHQDVPPVMSLACLRVGLSTVSCLTNCLGIAGSCILR